MPDPNEPAKKTTPSKRQIYVFSENSVNAFPRLVNRDKKNLPVFFQISTTDSRLTLVPSLEPKIDDPAADAEVLTDEEENARIAAVLAKYPVNPEVRRLTAGDLVHRSAEGILESVKWKISKALFGDLPPFINPD